MNKEKLELNLGMIKDAIEGNPGKDIQETIEKLQQLSSLMGLSCECMKYAKKFVLDAQKKAFENIDSKMTPTMLKFHLENECAEELMQYTYCERLNAAITHVCDSLRTVISLYKTELTISMNQPS